MDPTEQKFILISDIHGNLSAFEAVLQDCASEVFQGIILLGDIIDYGMRSNETVQKLESLASSLWKDKILVNIWGNHEKLVVDKDLDRLSSDRGRVMAQYTADSLSPSTLAYINRMERSGSSKFTICGLNCLAVHGSLDDPYWKAISPSDVHGDYSEYDLVFSGHSHYSHFFTCFYPGNDPRLRNKKAVSFINPGSVGQPRNRNPLAQYAVLSLPSRRVELRSTEYDIAYEQSLYPSVVDEFYKTRLTYGV